MTGVQGAASAGLRGAFDAEPTRLRVLAGFPHGCYLEPVGHADAGQPPLVSVVTAAATLHPNAVVLRRMPGPAAEAGGQRLFQGQGELAWIGRGRLVLGELTIRPARWWSPTPAVPALRSREALAARLRSLYATLAGVGVDLAPAGDDDAIQPGGGVGVRVLAARADELASALHRADAASAVVAGRRLIGLGAGSTPSGDDVVSALLVAAHALGRDLLTARQRAALDETGRRLVAHARDATTTLSYALLWHAARGQAAGPVAAMIRALAGHGSVEGCAPPLLAIGSSSGRDLAIGLAYGTRLVARSGMVAAPAGDGPTIGVNTRIASPLLLSVGNASPLATSGGGRSRP